MLRSPTPTRTKCIACGFEAPTGSDEWRTVTHPSLGSLAQCPECGSTDLSSRSA